MNSSFFVHQIKEIDDELVTNDFSYKDFEKLDYITTSLDAGFLTENSKRQVKNDESEVCYEEPVSVLNFTTTPTVISNQNTENITMEIATETDYYNEEKWENGRFVIELPEEIVDVDLNSVVSDNAKVEISSYEVSETNGKKYITVYTENDKAENYKITVNADVRADPRQETSSKNIKLYAYNENCNNYRNSSSIEDVLDIDGDVIEGLPISREDKIKASVTIMNGCNNFCSYCIVPYVRGRERSRKPEDIVAEVKKLASEGVVEVMLLGQNVNSYGKNLENPISFAKLLTMVEEVEGIERIRFMTSHPKDLSDELIEVMAHSKKICKHLHLPVQSGSSRILKLMNRKYTKEHYLTLVDKIRTAVPDIAITTDIIVGFPGETEEDFEETLDVVREVGFDSAYTYVYSKRSGTPAASMEDQVDKDVIKDRFDRLLALLKETSAKNCKKKVGDIERVLIEEENTHEEGMLTGRLENNLLVHFRGCKEQIGTMADVKLVEEKGFYYMGEQIHG